MGSSPLTRGKQGHGLHQVVVRGLIPAHAGKTSYRRRRYRPRPAHPRSRGENRSCGLVGECLEGSSPLTRGKRRAPTGSRRRRRLIPAHAGKTARGSRTIRAGRAHPRSRGENPGASWVTFAPAGSSPLTRGKRCDAPVPAPDGGLIPAHAGKTGRPRALACANAAHPRSRGENGVGTGVGFGEGGSSPLTRGKRAVAYELDYPHGLIPAHAGKTEAHR